MSESLEELEKADDARGAVEAGGELEDLEDGGGELEGLGEVRVF